MFSINEYRDSEKHHLSSIDSYVFSSMHNLDLFQSMGFPVRIERLRNLSLIIDSMQQNRFDRYMKELNGLHQNEFHLIVSALTKFAKLQSINFGDWECRLPITTFLLHSLFATNSKP